MWDAHCHLADPRLVTKLEASIERARARGVTAWIQGGISPEDWARQDELAARWGTEAVIRSYGLHPYWADKASERELDQALQFLEARLAPGIALGELGLDHGPKHGRTDESFERQTRAFEAQLGLARKSPRPLVLHVVRAHGRALEILRTYGPFPQGGLVHYFSGSLEVAEQYMKLGFMISVGGIANHEGFEQIKKALPRLPLERVVVETDAPDHGCELDSLPSVAEGLAPYWGLTAGELLERSTANLKRVFYDHPDVPSRVL